MDTETKHFTSEAAAVAEIATRHFKAEPLNIKDPRDDTEILVVLVPNGQGGIDIHDTAAKFDAARRFPLERKGTATFSRLDSFIGHVNRFKSTESALFAKDGMRDGAVPSITAVLDYHDRVNRDDDNIPSPDKQVTPSPRHGRHARLAHRAAGTVAGQRLVELVQPLFESLELAVETAGLDL